MQERRDDPVVLLKNSNARDWFERAGHANPEHAGNDPPRRLSRQVAAGFRPSVELRALAECAEPVWRAPRLWLGWNGCHGTRRRKAAASLSY